MLILIVWFFFTIYIVETQGQCSGSQQDFEWLCFNENLYFCFSQMERYSIICPTGECENTFCSPNNSTGDVYVGELCFQNETSQYCFYDRCAYCSDNFTKVSCYDFQDVGEGRIDNVEHCQYGCGNSSKGEIECYSVDCFVGSICPLNGVYCCNSSYIAECVNNFVDSVSSCEFGCHSFLSQNDECFSECEIGAICSENFSTNEWGCCEGDYPKIVYCNESNRITETISCSEGCSTDNQQCISFLNCSVGTFCNQTGICCNDTHRINCKHNRVISNYLSDDCTSSIVENQPIWIEVVIFVSVGIVGLCITVFVVIIILFLVLCITRWLLKRSKEKEKIEGEEMDNLN